MTRKLIPALILAVAAIGMQSSPAQAHRPWREPRVVVNRYVYPGYVRQPAFWYPDYYVSRPGFFFSFSSGGWDRHDRWDRGRDWHHGHNRRDRDWHR